MAAYLIAMINVTDLDPYKEYTRVTPGIVAKFGGRFLVRGGEVVTLEGPEETRRVVVIEFPSLGKAKEFYDSEDYKKAKELRRGAAIGQFLAIDGVKNSPS